MQFLAKAQKTLHALAPANFSSTISYPMIEMYWVFHAFPLLQLNSSGLLWLEHSPSLLVKIVSDLRAQLTCCILCSGLPEPVTARDLFLHYSTYHSGSYVFDHCHTSQVAISIMRTEIVSNFCISHNTYFSPFNQVCMHVSLNVLQSHKKNLYLD